MVNAEEQVKNETTYLMVWSILKQAYKNGNISINLLDGVNMRIADKLCVREISLKEGNHV